MSLLFSSKHKFNTLSYGNIKLKSSTVSTGSGTEKTERTFKTSRGEDEGKTLAFTLKKHLFPKGEIRKIKEINTEIKSQSPQRLRRLCSSLEINRKYSTQRGNNMFQSQLNNSLDKNMKPKLENNQQCILFKKSFPPIEMKCSSVKNKFSQSMIRAYALATCKGLFALTSSHLVLINLGLIKQFYLIQCIDGFDSGMIIKKNISYLLLKEYLQLVQQSQSNSKNKLNCLQSAVLKTFQSLQSKIRQDQLLNHHNSGSFITAFLIIDDHVLTINCGLGTSIMYLKKLKLIKLSEPHSTTNEKQMKRIINAGCQFYRTQFNVKYKEKLSVKGPLRLYPSGNSFTRVMGKTFDKIAQLKQLDPNISLNQQSNQKQPFLSKPQMTFIKCEDVQFMLIASSGLEEFLKISLICSIILHQIKKSTNSSSIHDLAGQCAKQVLNQAYIKGYSQTATVIIIFFGIDIQSIRQKEKEQNAKKAQNNNKSNFQSPLKYAGSKKSFCQYSRP